MSRAPLLGPTFPSFSVSCQSLKKEQNSLCPVLLGLGWLICLGGAGAMVLDCCEGNLAKAKVG